MKEDKPTVTDSRDKAILWLKDRIGRHVIVTCGYDVGFDAFVFHFEGKLRHWSADWQGTAVLAVPRDHNVGWFKVADATLDVTYPPVVYRLAQHRWTVRSCSVGRSAAARSPEHETVTGTLLLAHGEAQVCACSRRSWSSSFAGAWRDVLGAAALVEEEHVRLSAPPPMRARTARAGSRPLERGRERRASGPRSDGPRHFAAADGSLCFSSSSRSASSASSASSQAA